MFSKLVRLGRDAEMATTPNNKQVMRIRAAYDVGWGDNKRTVWVDGSMWGDRGAKLVQYLTKGTQIVIHANDVEPEAFQGNNGISTKLKMVIQDIELISRNQTTNQSGNYSNSTPQSRQPENQSISQATPPNMASSANSGFDDDIPF